MTKVYAYFLEKKHEFLGGGQASVESTAIINELIKDIFIKIKHDTFYKLNKNKLAQRYQITYKQIEEIASFVLGINSVFNRQKHFKYLKNSLISFNNKFLYSINVDCFTLCKIKKFITYGFNFDMLDEVMSLQHVSAITLGVFIKKNIKELQTELRLSDLVIIKICKAFKIEIQECQSINTLVSPITPISDISWTETKIDFTKEDMLEFIEGTDHVSFFYDDWLACERLLENQIVPKDDD